jgi:hypothetical protein
MTKEELFNEFDKMTKALPEKDYHKIKLLISVFLNDNICIPKGKNRHEYADVLHEWIEGTDCQWQYEKQGSTEWYDDMHVATTGAKRYRIKPSEPIYEWQWEYPSIEIDLITPNYMTVEEVEKTGIKLWCKTNTKRERK